MLAVEKQSHFFAHESAYVDEPAQIGEGTKIWHFSHISADTTIGKKCSIGQNVFVARGVTIGNNVKIQNNVSVYEGVELGDDVFCGPSMVFTNVLTPRSGTPRNQSSDYLKTRLARGSSVGANATIVCGVTIGEFAFIGAGAVVTRDIPAYALVYGNPARVHGYACECGLKLSFENDAAACECGRTFKKTGTLVERGEYS